MPVQQIIVNPAETENSKVPPSAVMTKDGEPSAAAPYSAHNAQNSATCSQCSSVSEIQTPTNLNSFSSALPQRSGSCLSTTSNGIFCRICHCESEASNPLITPCMCTGTLHHVHQGCLQQWIKSSDAKKCELCRYEFQMEAKTKPFRKWQALDMSQSERRKILCSVSFHVIAITCVVWSLWVLIDRTAQEIEEGQFDWSFWTKLVVVAIGFTGGVVFMYVQCKVYVQLWKRLRAYNRIILVKNAPHIADTAQYL